MKRIIAVIKHRHCDNAEFEFQIKILYELLITY